MGNQVEQWPWTGAGTVDLLRMSSQAGVTVAKPKRVPGAEARGLMGQGLVELDRGPLAQGDQGEGAQADRTR